MQQRAQEPIRSRGPLRWLLLGSGVLLSGLAVLGAFLPVLPTTPFLLLAVAAFARSSPRMHQRLLEAPIFGVYLRQWRHDHSIPLHAKRKAYGLTLVTFGLSIWAVESVGLRAGLALLGLGLLGFLRSLRATEHELAEYEDSSGEEERDPSIANTSGAQAANSKTAGPAAPKGSMAHGATPGNGTKSA